MTNESVNALMPVLKIICIFRAPGPLIGPAGQWKYFVFGISYAPSAIMIITAMLKDPRSISMV